MIDAATLDAIATALAGSGVDARSVAALRQQYPDVHFTHCSDDDILDASPVKECGTFNLYLVDGRDHCLRMTMNADDATGVVLADVEPED